MEPEYQRIAIIGASGLLGKPIVNQLSKAGFALTLLSRDSSKLKETFSELQGVTFVEADVDDTEDLKKAFNGTLLLEMLTIGIDAIISVVGSLALATQIGYIDAAVEAGVKRFIPSEFGCDTQAPYLFHPKLFANNSQEEMIFAQKRGVTAYLKELSDLNKITYTLISTGTLPSDGLIVRSLFHVRSSVSCCWD